MRIGKAKFKIKKDNGQAALEFTLVIPILVIMILVVSQLGHVVYLKNILEQAAREGVRVISTTNSNHKACEQIKKICSALDQDRLSIKISPVAGAHRKIGDVATVGLTFRCGGFASLIRMLTGKDILINVESSMRMECY